MSAKGLDANMFCNKCCKLVMSFPSGEIREPFNAVCLPCFDRLTSENAELQESAKRADLWKDRESATQAKYEAVCYERDTLKTENFALSAIACPEVEGDEGGTAVCKLKAHVAELEQDKGRLSILGGEHHFKIADYRDALEEIGRGCCDYDPGSCKEMAIGRIDWCDYCIATDALKEGVK